MLLMLPKWRTTPDSCPIQTCQQLAPRNLHGFLEDLARSPEKGILGVYRKNESLQPCFAKEMADSEEKIANTLEVSSKIIVQKPSRFHSRVFLNVFKGLLCFYTVQRSCFSAAASPPPRQTSKMQSDKVSWKLLYISLPLHCFFKICLHIGVCYNSWQSSKIFLADFSCFIFFLFTATLQHCRSSIIHFP